MTRSPNTHGQVQDVDAFGNIKQPNCSDLGYHGEGAGDAGGRVAITGLPEPHRYSDADTALFSSGVALEKERQPGLQRPTLATIRKLGRTTPTTA